ncbi:9472_t:CDS:2 [Gigaspora margarita]|uniref:9472_t:CDS:1 n=1 Tax=Gigaspora margarita TaxID=4874 RepID=A0ABN7UJU0_GIGMA|nr:9472_t:CDS:2 [Gigaspora margarita]
MEYNIRSHDDNSEGEESNSVLDDESISDDDFSDIPLNKLNEFNFVDVPDNYIEDKIYDDLKLKIKKFFDKAFQRNENTDKVTNDDKKNLHFSYCYNHDIPVCLDTYLNLVGVGRTYLKNIKQHLQEHGLEERIHGNTSRAPKNMNRIEVNYDLVCDIFKFLKNYSNIHGMPSPERHCNKITMPTVFLPTSFSYASVYRDYVQACKDKYGKDAHILAESTFTNIWKSLMPSLQFMSSKTDLCELQKERNYYNANIINAVEDSKHNPNVVGSQILFKSFSSSAYIAYDWAQNVQIPYSLQQIGALFFKSLRKVHLFSVCNTSNFPHTQQMNYVIDEAEMPDDGKQGQNKNNFSLFFYSWLVDRKMYDEVELNFMIPGHTKFICDGCFGLIKILYRKSKVNTVEEVVSIVNHSTRINFNVAQHYLNGEGFQYYNFKNYFQAFKKLPHIQKYHHFYFTSQHPGIVFFKDDLQDNYESFTICPFSFNADTPLPTIDIKPLSQKRQEELYKEIAPYIDLPFCNIICPEPKIQDKK